MTACAVEVVASDGQSVVVALADGSGNPVTLYEDSGCLTSAERTEVGAYPGTETSRVFYAQTAGTYTITVTQDGAVLHQGPLTLTAGVTKSVGPYPSASFAGGPAPQLIDGGTP